MAAAKPDETEKPAKSRALTILGPGLITGASDDDPSGIATYSQVGAQFGFSISWTMLFSYPLMAAIQEISGRIGRTTGRGVAGNIRRHYPTWLLNVIVGLLFIANTINIGADLGAMGDALSLLIGGPHLLYVVLAGVLCVVLQIFVQYTRYRHGRGYSLEGNGARPFHTHAFRKYNILDVRGRHSWDHN